MKKIFDYCFKSKQLHVIKKLLIKQDVILIAKTNFEKNIIFQTVFNLIKEVCFKIVSLTISNEKQFEKINNLSIQCKVIMLSIDKCTLFTLLQIRKKVYLHVFLNLKIVIDKLFNEQVLKHFCFQQQLILIAIDKLHITKQWKKWRNKYNQLFVFKAKLNIVIFIFNISTIIISFIISIIRETVNFKDNAHIIRIIIDWSNIYLKVRKQFHTTINLENLRFLFKQSFKFIYCISKIIVYVFIINDTTRIIIILWK